MSVRYHGSPRDPEFCNPGAFPWEDGMADNEDHRTYSDEDNADTGRQRQAPEETQMATASTWWELGTLPALGDSHVNTNWVDQALEQGALRGQPTRVRTEVQGYVPGGQLKDVTESLVADYGGRLIVEDLPTREGGEARGFLVWDHGAVNVYTDGQGHFETVVTSRDRDFVVRVQTWLRAKLGPKPAEGQVYIMTSSSHGYEFKALGKANLPLERANYGPEVLQAYDRLREDLPAADPAGRLNIVDGPPGTGKTFLVRGLLQDVQGARFVIIQAHMLADLAMPGLVKALMDFAADGDPLVFIIEDADEILATRDRGNISSISAVLNFSDGLLGIKLDIRILCTTNAKQVELDPAVVRARRLGTTIHVGRLSCEQAYGRVEALLGRKMNADDVKRFGAVADEGKGVSLAEVYAIARDAGWRPTKTQESRVMGFGA